MTHDHSHHGGHCCSHDSHCCSHHGSMDHSHDDSCHAHHHHCCSEHEHDDFYAQLIEMADEAWMEVLKCKIKEEIKNKTGTHLDELAKIVSDANHYRWKHKMEARKGGGDFKEKVRNFFDRTSNNKG